MSAHLDYKVNMSTMALKHSMPPTLWRANDVMLALQLRQNSHRYMIGAIVMG